jgi:hypothetical protein
MRTLISIINYLVTKMRFPIERISPFVAQDAGYYPAYVLNE